MRARTFAALMALLLCASPLAAQETRGSIEGIVKDASGGVLPGVTVEAKSAAGTSTTVTDASGIFRFPSLTPGAYKVTATLQGFKPAKSDVVELSLGAVLKLNLGLELGGLTESVQITAESPLIDVKNSAAGQNINAAFIDRLPKGRDFSSLVTLAPGANKREPQRRHLDRRRVGVREPVLHRRHRHDEPAHWRFGQGAPDRIRRTGAGQVERLCSRVRRLDRRRRQRRHQERQQPVPR